jgi:hypothetical protein
MRKRTISAVAGFVDQIRMSVFRTSRALISMMSDLDDERFAKGREDGSLHHGHPQCLGLCSSQSRRVLGVEGYRGFLKCLRTRGFGPATHGWVAALSKGLSIGHCGFASLQEPYVPVPYSEITPPTAVLYAQQPAVARSRSELEK